MKINWLHRLDVTPSEAIKLQSELASSVVVEDDTNEVSTVAGVDVSAGLWNKQGRAAVVVMAYPSMEIIEKSILESPLPMPYIPGLLSFRELPLILPAIEQLETEPDLFIVDGQGVAHPRGLGIAAHLGLFTGKATIGCAKSRLCGAHEALGFWRGSWADLVDHGQIIGRVIRSRDGIKPLYISPGHKVSLETAVAWVLKLGGRYRLPEPIRQAHVTAGAGLQRG